MKQPDYFSNLFLFDETKRIMNEFELENDFKIEDRQSLLKSVYQKLIDRSKSSEDVDLFNIQFHVYETDFDCGMIIQTDSYNEGVFIVCQFTELLSQTLHQMFSLTKAGR